MSIEIPECRAMPSHLIHAYPESSFQNTTPTSSSPPQKAVTKERVYNPRWEHVDDTWRENLPQVAHVGDTIELMVTTEGLADGVSITFDILDNTIPGDDKEAGDGTASVSGNSRLKNAYNGEEKYYIDGVGANFLRIGAAFSSCIRRRINDMLRHLKKTYKQNPELVLDVFGFSRGAAAAREFANEVHEKYPEIKIRFLGLYDTVAQVGLPDRHNRNLNVDIDIPTNVQYVAHAIAVDEFRSLFPLTSIMSAYQNTYEKEEENPRLTMDMVKDYKGHSFYEKRFRGTHGQVGGSGDDYNGESLRWMVKLALTKEVPLDELELLMYYKVINVVGRDGEVCIDDIGNYTSNARGVFAGNLIGKSELDLIRQKVLMLKSGDAIV